MIQKWRNFNQYETTDYVGYKRARRKDAEPIKRNRKLQIIGSFFLIIIFCLCEADVRFPLSLLWSFISAFQLHFLWKYIIPEAFKHWLP